MTEPPTVQFPGIDIELGKVLHASERVKCLRHYRLRASARAVTRFTDIWDKGKAAVIWSETTVSAPDGTLLWTQKRSIFARGEGGFGGERGPSGGGSSEAHPTGHPISSLRCRSCRSRHCCTGCAAIATRCTPIPNSPLPQAFPGRFCTGCAPTA